MEKQNNLTKYENEFYSEINELEVCLSDIKKLGVSDKVLSCEKYLYDIYGDEILGGNTTSDEVEENAKKQVVKLSEAEKSIDKEFLNICEFVDDNEFDKNLEIILGNLK